MDNNNLLDFILVGTAKAGTTSIYHYLRQHPEIYIPQKETFFFMKEKYLSIDTDDPAHRLSEDIVYDFDHFSSLYKDNRGLVTGDIATGYLFNYKVAIPEMKTLDSEPKIIIILRNPIDRAFSNYMHMIRNNFEDADFITSAKNGEARLASSWDFMWGFLELGLYYEQVKAFKENFKNVLILDYDDFFTDLDSNLSSLCEFINAAPDFSFKTNKKYNKTGAVKNNVFTRVLLRENWLKSLFIPVSRFILGREKTRWLKQSLLELFFEKKRGLSLKEKQFLYDFYHEDMSKLNDIVDFDVLEKWGWHAHN